MNSEYVQLLKLQDLETGNADDLAKFLFNVWKKQRGEPGIPAELGKVAQNLLLMAGEAAEGDSPDLLFVGDKTMLARVLPQTTEADAPKDMMPTDFRSFVHEGFHRAISGEPNYDLVSTIAYPDGNPVRLVYERLILPFRLKTGLVHLVNYVIEREIVQLNGLTNPEAKAIYSTPLPSRGRLSPVAVPTVSLQGELPNTHKPADSALTTPTA
ncbi:hypothetical protein [Roseibium aggregatum]|uniref:hypothetical protein n=1 Tax=Roseibium aggregatum TaxID=187304 RepID=UPI001E32E28D|nr:hypothetical protein [Roseibium aggregatum]UES51602.1 hypothetical protein GFK88_19470 [Roseibium aggregatum]